MKPILASIICLLFLFSCEKKIERKLELKNKVESALSEKPKKDSCDCETKIKTDSIFYGANLKIEEGEIQFNCAEVSVTTKMLLDPKTKSTFCKTDTHVYCVSKNQKHVAISPKLNINKALVNEKSFYLFRLNPKREVIEVEELRQN